MFIKTKTINDNDYFYLMQSQRLEGKAHPTPKTVVYLGRKDTAIATLEASDYPNKDELLARVRAAAPVQGKNQGRRGRPRKTAELVGFFDPKVEKSHRGKPKKASEPVGDRALTIGGTP